MAPPQNIYILKLMRQAQQAGQHSDLLTLLIAFMFSESTLVRDRFYALLGVAADRNDERFEIDYVSPVEVVIQKYAAAFVQNGKVEDLVDFADIGLQYLRLPSWITDWSFPKCNRPALLGNFNRQYKACEKSQLQFRLSSNADVLFLRGFLFDSAAGLSTNFHQSSIRTVEYFQELESMIRDLRYPSRMNYSAGFRSAIGKRTSTM